MFWKDYYSYSRENSECLTRGPKIARIRNEIPVFDGLVWTSGGGGEESVGGVDV
jgi:hypothetical protein